MAAPINGSSSTIITRNEVIKSPDPDRQKTHAWQGGSVRIRKIEHEADAAVPPGRAAHLHLAFGLCYLPVFFAARIGGSCVNPPVRLTQAEYDRLGVFLLGSEEDAFEMPLLSTVDGLLTAVAICPEPIPETEWLDVILGAERPNFKSDDEAGEIVGLLRRMCLEIREALAADPPTFEPLLEIDVDGSLLGEIWGEGFGAGVELRPNIFLPLAEHPTGARCLGPLLVLSVPQVADMLESNRRKRQRLLRSYSEAIDICAAAAYRVARMSEEERVSALARLDEELLEEASESAKKVGRNEPCPCGSGKKFKRCCGADA